MNKFLRNFHALVPALALALTVPLLRAADHGDAPAVSHDQGADIADLYTFLDPADNSQVVIIGTLHGFIVPAEATNFAWFDPTVRFRFEIYNKHVQSSVTPPMDPGASASAAQKAAFAKARTAYLNTITPARIIDVVFNKRSVAANAQDDRINLARATTQYAGITLSGFPGAPNKGVFVKDSLGSNLLVTPPTSGLTANTRLIHSLQYGAGADTSKNIKFFAGESDDPFFFDLVGFSRLITSIHDHATDPSQLSRARDSFAGYNVLAIAFSIPKSLLIDAGKPIIGVDFVTQRQTYQVEGVDGPTGLGAFRTVDRMGNPAVNVALLPFNKKNTFNAYYPKADAAGFFLNDIATTITQLNLGTPPNKVDLLASLAVFKGDMLFLNTDIANTGAGSGTNTPAAYPNGRRLADDVIDTILTVLAGDALMGPVGDGVSANDVTFADAFPFVALPQQPSTTGTLDDRTRN